MNDKKYNVKKALWFVAYFGLGAFIEYIIPILPSYITTMTFGSLAAGLHNLIKHKYSIEVLNV